MRRRGEQNSERGQNEQASSRLDSPPRSFVQRSFTAEPLCCGGIVSMAVGPSHAIVQTINASSGGAIQTVIPIQKRKSFSASAIASANTPWVVVVTTVPTSRRGLLAPRRVATLEESPVHPARDSIGHLQHAECPHEDSSTFNVEEHPERGHEMYYASHRDEFGAGVLRNSLCALHSRCHSSQSGFPQSGVSPIRTCP